MVVNEVYKGHKKELALLKSMLQFRVVLLHKLREAGPHFGCSVHTQ